MPLYEYECLSCGGRSEVMQKFSDSPLQTCDACGGALERLISAPAIQFKGTGWYVTDYGRKSTGEGAGKKDGDENKSSSQKTTNITSQESCKSSSPNVKSEHL